MIRSLVRWNRRISEKLSDWAPGYFRDNGNYAGKLADVIEQSVKLDGPQIVLEAGGVDRPMLGRGRGYRFVGLDIEQREKCADLYDDFIVQSIEEPVQQQVDMIVSITLMEHVPDNSAAVNAMFKSLKEGGTTHHYIPSANHPYSLALRLVGSKMQKLLIPILRPGAEAVTGYPVFFDHCSPGAMTRLFVANGFTDIQVTPFYRANDYYAFFVPAYLLITTFENICRALNWSYFASGFVISARKGATAVSSA